jgi:CRP/FNR family transcriptional regulator, cyclic AMP receptor protein
MQELREAFQAELSDLPITFLKDVSILGGLLGPSLERVVRCLRRRALPAGAVIFAEGDAARALYIVERGAVQITQEALVLRLVEPGGSLGEMALLDIQPRAATARTCCPTTVLELPYCALATVQAVDLEAFTLLIMNLAREVSRRLRRTQDRLAQVARPAALGAAAPKLSAPTCAARSGSLA